MDPTLMPYGVAVVEDDPRLRTRLAMQLGDGVRAASFGSLDALEDRFGPGEPIVAILGPSFALAGGLARVEEFTRNHREIGTILVTDLLSTDLMQQALRAGVRDVVASLTDTGQLLDAVGRVANSLALAAPLPPGPAAEAPADELGRVITVFSTKGGAGKSMVASNLAVTLAKRSPKPVVLVDADLQFGDIAVMLKIVPQHTIVDAVANAHRLDAQLLQSLLVTHPSTGLLVLPAPLEPAFADQVSAANLVSIVQVLRTFCGHVVIDTPAQFNDVVLALLEETSDILVIAGMDIPNIKNVKLGLQTLRLLNTPMSKVKLVLNRANSKVRLDVAEVERTLGIKADCLIPSDIVVPQSVNKGVPAVLDAPKSTVARSIEQLTDLFLLAPVEPKRGRR